MGFSKKHQKTAQFIGGFCAIRGLSIAIGLIFDRLGLDYDRFDEKLVAHMIALENIILAEKAIQNPENMVVHIFGKWQFIGALMVRHRASDGKMSKIGI